MASTRITPSQDFRLEMEKLSGQKISRCYQCGKCTAGCPAAHHMDLGPRRIMRGIQLGLKDDVLNSSTIWLCMACQTCSARCPLQIDIARVLETLRHKAVAEHRVPGDRRVATFHRTFLREIQRRGHVYELGLGGAFNLRSWRPFLNAELLPRMVLKGKLPLLPHHVKGKSQIKAIFDRIKALEANSADSEK
ncbi:MAG: 4Fe-4S dicluster domain-containing protein [Chloroflexi bacterium]|nr:4Fe-4S dicluster domain-containing protein [Chloroflexota bacterium]